MNYKDAAPLALESGVASHTSNPDIVQSSFAHASQRIPSTVRAVERHRVRWRHDGWLLDCGAKQNSCAERKVL